MPSKKSVTRWTGATRLPERERKREKEREREREKKKEREKETETKKREREREKKKREKNRERMVEIKSAAITRKGDEINERIGHNRKRRELLKTSTQWRQSAVKVKFDKCFNTANSVHSHVI